ncbi:uncharacterized protein LOC123517627 [Portunus trituberculatus]|uniref:uncharacterized protein LOC123517627 n=1 Tax=Portunus trituberculatus TaxID=210409 RepID=UPI001E1D12A6|nr:uncharacterized protein LOC123517627 [Portunus trituberculatus]
MVLLLVVLNLEGSPNTTLASDCPADVVVKEGVTQVVFTEDIKFPSSFETGWYVKPGSDIENVHFVVVGNDGTHHTAWFPVDRCFQNDEWWKFTMGTWLNNSRFGFVLRFMSSECWKGCQFNTSPPELYSLTLLAHGNSSWREYSPFNCGANFPINRNWPDSLPPCMEPPPSTPTPLPCSFMLGMLLVALMVAEVVVVVVVVVCRKRRLASSNKERFQPQPAALRPHLQLTAGQGLVPDQDEHHSHT